MSEKMTIGPGDVAEVSLGQAPFKSGDTAIYMGEVQALRGREVLVLVVNDPAVRPGKPVGVCFREPIHKLTTPPKQGPHHEPKPEHPGHSCDGLGPDGHCRWVREDQLLTKEAWAKIQKGEAVVAAAKASGIDAAIEKFLRGEK
jgi:hypothetical protein